MTTCTVALAVTVASVGERYSAAILNLWRVGAIDGGLGHAQVHKLSFMDRRDALTAEHLLQPDQPLLANLSQSPAVAAISRRINFEGLVNGPSKSIYGLFRGVDYRSEVDVSPGLKTLTISSKSFSEILQSGQAIVGRGLSETLDLKVGDRVSITTHTIAGSSNGIDLVIGGIINHPIRAISRRLVILELQQAQSILGTGNSVTELAVRLKPSVDQKIWVESHEAKLKSAGLDLSGWWALDPLITKIEEIWSTLTGVVTLLLLVAAGLSILNIFLMVVGERRIEIGTLIAIGARRRDIRRMVAAEAVLTGIIGAAVGIIATVVVTSLLAASRLSFSSPFGANKIEARPEVDFGAMALYGVFGILIALIAALIPAHKAARIRAVNAFRGRVS